MNALVQKYGGTSVGSIERIQRVAAKALEARQSGQDVVVVVSAMAKETDRLLSLVKATHRQADQREADVVASSGETVAAALTAIAIQALGGKARSWLGPQLPILTDSNASAASILSVETRPLEASFRAGEIPVVAGFQGVDRQGRITTLGRGGSDTTAVAVAAALGARCEIYTDVDGVYSADPRLCPEALLLSRVSYQFMLEAAGLGAKVMHDRSVALGMRYVVPIAVKSSFSNSEGTEIGVEGDSVHCITSQAIDESVSRVSWVGARASDLAFQIPRLLRQFQARALPCYGVSAGLLSLSFLLPSARSAETVQWMHQLCSSVREGVPC